MHIHSKTSTQVAAGMDIAATLAIEHVGTTFHLPFYHPFIVGPVMIITYALFKWKEELTHGFIRGYRRALDATRRTTKETHTNIRGVSGILPKLSTDLSRTIEHVGNHIAANK